MPSQFDVYVLQEYVPVWMGKAKSLDDAERIIKAESDGSRFLVYSQPSGVNVFYERTPDGLSVCRKVKHAAA